MSKAKEIRTKIKNIKNTQKITHAMEMLSASKIKKSQDAMRASRPFATAISELLSNISTSQLKEHYFFITRPAVNIGLLIISTDRGLCGGLNASLFRKCLHKIKEWQHNNASPSIKIVAIGEKCKTFFGSKLGYNILASSQEKMSTKPEIKNFIGVIQVLLKEYKEKKIDSIYIAYNKFETTILQTPIIQQLVPIVNGNLHEHCNHSTEYLFEPDATSLLDLLLKRYIESMVYQGVVENIACEQAARMLAMKSATDNAQQIIENLQLNYNKERQATITKEISEIVAGAEGVI